MGDATPSRAYSTPSRAYRLFLTHSFDYDLGEGLQIQIKADRSILRLVEEISLPSNLISQVSGSWSNGDGFSTDINQVGNVVYQLNLLQASNYLFELQSENTFLYLVDEEGNSIEGEYAYSFSDASFNEHLDIGTYYVIISPDAGSAGQFDLSVKSNITQSAVLSLYSQ